MGPRKIFAVPFDENACLLLARIRTCCLDSRRPPKLTPQKIMINPDPQFWANRKVLITGHTGFKGWTASSGTSEISTDLAERPCGGGTRLNATRESAWHGTG
jgi:hypothetical protein